MPLFSHAKNSGRVRANCVRLRPAASQLSTMTTYLLTHSRSLFVLCTDHMIWRTQAQARRQKSVDLNVAAVSAVWRGMSLGYNRKRRYAGMQGLVQYYLWGGSKINHLTNYH